jgi:hypothetical protein
VESGIWIRMGYVRDVLICPSAAEIWILKMRDCDRVS